MNFKKNPIEKNNFFLRKKISEKKFLVEIFFWSKIFNQKIYIFLKIFFRRKKIIFFDRIFFKVHLKIEEIRFLRVSCRSEASRASYEPKTEKISQHFPKFSLTVFGAKSWIYCTKISEIRKKRKIINFEKL